MPSWNKDDKILGGDVGNYSLAVKKAFLTFIQGYFKDHPKYAWTPSMQTTKIVILDKFSYDTQMADKKPSVVLSRGTMGWQYTSLKQRMSKELGTGRETYQDLISGSLILHCSSVNGMVAEEIASILFNIITVYKDYLKKEGIYYIDSVRIGEERPLKIDSNFNMQTVPISLRFLISSSLGKTISNYSITIQKKATYVAPSLTGNLFDSFELAGKYSEEWKTGEITSTLLEGVDYDILLGGARVRFSSAPYSSLTIVSGIQNYDGVASDGTTPFPSEGTLIDGNIVYTVVYKSATDLTDYTITLAGMDGSETDFLLPEEVYGYGPVLSGVTFVRSGTVYTLSGEDNEWVAGSETEVPWF